MYSLICRHANVSLIPNQLPSDARISGFGLKVPSPELERSLIIKERLEASMALKKLLLILVLAGTAMVIADAVVTPAMSGTMSHINYREKYVSNEHYYCMNKLQLILSSFWTQ